MEENKVNNNSNKGLIVWLVILSILVIGLGGFIVYDKVLKNDETTDVVENKEEKEEVENEKEEIDENKEYVKNQIKVDNYEYTLNGKEHTVSIVYSYKEVEAEEDDLDYGWTYFIYTTVAFDGKIIEDTKTLIMHYEDKEIVESKLYEFDKDYIKTIKGTDEKDYLVVSLDNHANIYADFVNSSIINDKGKVITTFVTGFGLGIVDESIREKFNGEYYVTDDAFYYIDDENIVGEMLTTDADLGEYTTVQEFKVTVDDNIITKTPTKTYKAMMAGQ